ncbi:MAG: hypothetical protein ACI9FU_002287 [Granulosicoccus sp.]|jgi:hypothetical protein
MAVLIVPNLIAILSTQYHINMKFIISLIIAAVSISFTTEAFAQSKEPSKTEKSIEKAADKTEKAVMKAADKTEKAVLKAADEVEKGTIKAVKAIEKAALKAADKVDEAFDD